MSHHVVVDQDVRALCSAFWIACIESLLAGDEETRQWLDTDDAPGYFLWWCDMSNKPAAWWRERLIRVYEEGYNLEDAALSDSRQDD